MKSGRASKDVYAALKAEMDAAREAYREKFLTPVNGTADYLHIEFVRTLAGDDASLLGLWLSGASMLNFPLHYCRGSVAVRRGGGPAMLAKIMLVAIAVTCFAATDPLADLKAGAAAIDQKKY